MQIAAHLHAFDELAAGWSLTCSYLDRRTSEFLSPVHTSNNVEATFDIVEATFDIVAFDNVASTLLLV